MHCWLRPPLVSRLYKSWLRMLFFFFPSTCGVVSKTVPLSIRMGRSMFLKLRLSMPVPGGVSEIPRLARTTRGVISEASPFPIKKSPQVARTRSLPHQLNHPLNHSSFTHQLIHPATHPLSLTHSKYARTLRTTFSEV